MSASSLNVAVIGGGIGGMAVAAALAQRGAKVRLHEQAAALTEIGAGLQISVNGQRVLSALGVDPELTASAISSTDGTLFVDGESGREVAHVPSPLGGATWYMHRADLLNILHQCADKAGVQVNLGRYVTPGTVDADVVIVCDGVRSVWRAGVDGPDAARFTGQVAWRALVPGREPFDERAVLAMGHKAHVVSYPLRGGALRNIVAVEERKDWTEESWSTPGNPAEFRSRFAEFRGSIGRWISEAEDVHVWALFARPVAENWHQGNTVLLGDAAHPTLPFMAQGACLALEDAWVLADALDQFDTVAEALQRYEEARQFRTKRVVALAKGNAWRFHMRKPLAWAAQAVLSVGARRLARRLDWLYEYDATRAFEPGFQISRSTQTGT